MPRVRRAGHSPADRDLGSLPPLPHRQLALHPAAALVALSLELDGAVAPDAAWYCLEPKEAAQEIAGRVASWKDFGVR